MVSFGLVLLLLLAATTHGQDCRGRAHAFTSNVNSLVLPVPSDSVEFAETATASLMLSSTPVIGRQANERPNVTRFYFSPSNWDSVFTLRWQVGSVGVHVSGSIDPTTNLTVSIASALPFTPLPTGRLQADTVLCANVENCTTCDTISLIVVVPVVQGSLERKVAGGAAAAASVAAVVTGVGVGAAMDAQFLSVVALMPCSGRIDWQLGIQQVRALTPLAFLTGDGELDGTENFDLHNLASRILSDCVLLLFGGVVFHAIAVAALAGYRTWRYGILPKVSFLESAALLRHPNSSITLYLVLHYGVSFSSIVVVLNGPSQLDPIYFVGGLLGLLWAIVFPFVISIAVAKPKETELVACVYTKFRMTNIFQRVMSPLMFWQPKLLVQRFGVVLAQFLPRRSPGKFFMIFYCWLPFALCLIAGLPAPGNKAFWVHHIDVPNGVTAPPQEYSAVDHNPAACKSLHGLLIVMLLGAAIFIGITKPHKSYFQNIASVIALFTNALFAATELAAEGVRRREAQDLILAFATLLLLGRVVVCMVVEFMELTRWRRNDANFVVGADESQQDLRDAINAEDMEVIMSTEHYFGMRRGADEAEEEDDWQGFAPTRDGQQSPAAAVDMDAMPTGDRPTRRVDRNQTREEEPMPEPEDGALSNDSMLGVL